MSEERGEIPEEAWMFISKITYPGVMQGEIIERAIIRMIDLQIPIRYICKCLKVSPKKVIRISKEWKKFHMFTVKSPGRPSKITKEEYDMINTLTEEDPRLTCSKIVDEFKTMDKAICKSSIANARHQLKFKFLPPKRRPLLTEANCFQRLRFAYSMLSNKERNKKIVFSDEAKVQICSDNSNVWRKRGSTNPKIYVDEKKFIKGIMIFGAIGIDYKSKLVISPIEIDSEQYCYNVQMLGILNRKDDFIFMQDGAKAHTALSTIKWLKKRMNILGNWPPNSPDLNPIEIIWRMLKQWLKTQEINSVNELSRLCTHWWNNILTLEQINSLVHSFNDRLNLCIIEGGRNINNYIRNHKLQLSEELTAPPPKSELVLYKEEELINHIDPNIEDQPDFEPNRRALLDLNEGNKAIRRIWSEEEDQKLINFVVNFGHNWSKVPLIFGNTRTSNQVMHRFHVLKREKKFDKLLAINE